jgi:translation initiation factor IF-2
VTSKQILAKCRAEGLDIKNHMTALSAGLEATIREWFSEGASSTAVEATQRVDLQTAREEARKTRRRKKAPEPAKPAEGEGKLAEQEPLAAATAVAEASPPGIGVQEEAPRAAAGVAPREEEPAKAAVAAQAAEATPGVEVKAPAAEQAQPPSIRKEREAKGEKPPEIKPAGPQLVPRPAVLKGPRVVRVERPDSVVRAGRRAPLIPAGPEIAGVAAPTGTRRGKGELVEAEEGQAGRKKGKRRSARRRGGRTADSGESIREWRDQDLAERSQRLAAATGGGLRRYRAAVPQQRLTEFHPAAKAGPVEIEEPITIRSLSAATGIKTANIIRKLMDLGVMATANQTLEPETAETAVLDYNIELVINRPKTAEEELREHLEARPRGAMVPRAPVVTFLGHVDHGKTSLLDRIRKTMVAKGEAGGITQHIGAYRYDDGNKHVVFLDTPGHEAFTAMRARGANMTDVVVLVVAADDGVMPQTVEAISHAKAAGVPIVVALNKIDLPNANPTRVLGQLAEHGLNPRQWEGNVEVIPTSAVTGAGIDQLVETLSLEAELLELRAERDAPASGFVIEANIDSGLGAVARLLVRNGTVRIGDILLAGSGYGRVRQMTDDRGRTVAEAGPSTPVEVSGLDQLPQAGDRFYVADDLEQARMVANDCRQMARTRSLAAGRQVTLENLLSKIQAGESNELAVILKADVQGSLEALSGSLTRLGTEEVRLNILHAAVGAITTGDVTLAEASGAIILGFNVVPDSATRVLAETEGVDIRLYRVIYDLLEDVRKALAEGLAPEVREEVLGRAEVRQVFKISRLGTVAGCYITDGLVSRNAKVRIIRNNVVLEDARGLDSLKRFKDDAREVRAGLECGLKISGYDDVKEGDLLEFYQQVEVARKL